MTVGRWANVLTGRFHGLPRGAMLPLTGSQASVSQCMGGKAIQITVILSPSARIKPDYAHVLLQISEASAVTLCKNTHTHNVTGVSFHPHQQVSSAGTVLSHIQHELYERSY